MTQRMDRREFSVAAALLLLGGAAITVSGCGGSGYGGGGSPTGGGGGGDSDYGPGGNTGDGEAGLISSNHGHRAVITDAQLTAGNGMMLDIRGTATHTHSVELSADEVVRIRGGPLVSEGASTTDSHNHNVTFN